MPDLMLPKTIVPVLGASTMKEIGRWTISVQFGCASSGIVYAFGLEASSQKMVNSGRCKTG